MDLVQARIIIRNVEASRRAVESVRSSLSGVRKDAIRAANVQTMSNRALYQSYGALARGAEDSARRQRNAMRSVANESRSMMRTMGSLGPIAGMAGGFGLLRGYQMTRDAYQQRMQFQSTMRLMYGAQRVPGIEKAVGGMAKRWGAPIQGIRTGVMGLAGVKGMTSERALEAIESMTKIGLASGITGADMEGFLVQLRQMLGSGFVQGDELRLMSERMPFLNSVLGAFGTSAGAIRDRNKSGNASDQMSADEFLQMFVEYAKREDITREATTMSKSWMAEETRLANKVNEEFSDLGKRVAPAMSSALTFLTNNLGIASAALITFTVALGVGSARNALGGLLGLAAVLWTKRVRDFRG